MKIELKNIKVMNSLSEETVCFSASIYVDGKKAGQASNRGHGGNTDYRFTDRELEKRFEEYAKSLPSKVFHIDDFGTELEIFPANIETNKDYFVMCMDGEHLIDNLLNEWMKRDDERKESAKIAKLDKKYKADCESKGMVCIRIKTATVTSWVPCKSRDSAAERVEKARIEKKLEILSWEIL